MTRTGKKEESHQVTVVLISSRKFSMRFLLSYMRHTSVSGDWGVVV